jgi:hypothetical protein
LQLEPGEDDAVKAAALPAIELLLIAPVRIQNLSSIRLDRHLLEVGGHGNRTVHLRFRRQR